MRHRGCHLWSQLPRKFAMMANSGFRIWIINCRVKDQPSWPLSKSHWKMHYDKSAKNKYHISYGSKFVLSINVKLNIIPDSKMRTGGTKIKYQQKIIIFGPNGRHALIDCCQCSLSQQLALSIQLKPLCRYPYTRWFSRKHRPLLDMSERTKFLVINKRT